MFKQLTFFVVGFFLWANTQAQTFSLLDILTGKSELVDHILANQADFEVQLIRGKDQSVSTFTQQLSNDLDRYYYPASTVKLPVAILALEKLNELGIPRLSSNSEMRTEKARSVQKQRITDSTSVNGLPSIAHDIKKVFLFSENDAYNRLFEFLGADYINTKLGEKGIRNSRIIHRVGVSGFSLEENRFLNPIGFYQNDSLLYHQAADYSKFESNFQPSFQQKGKGYLAGGKLVSLPMDFSQKNYIPLVALHGILQRVLFPENFQPSQRFNLTSEDYQLLYNSMATYPSESRNPKVDFPDGYVKFFLYGGNEKEIPKHIRIFNKVGDAYGYLTDVAYIVDLKNNVEFLLSGVIHVNENQIYNDNIYEYEKTGLPFFKAVGEIIYNYELERQKEVIPDLSKFRALFSDY